jgi:hypothetical protein
MARALAAQGKLDLRAPGMIGWWTGPVGEQLRESYWTPEPDRYELIDRGALQFLSPEVIARAMRAKRPRGGPVATGPPGAACTELSEYRGNEGT